MNRSLLTAGLAAVAAALSLAVAASPSAAEPDDVVLTGRVVSSSGQPLKDISVSCIVSNRSYPEIIARTDSEGRYSFTQRQFDDEAGSPDEIVYSCYRLSFYDATGRYVTTGWPNANGAVQGSGIDLDPENGPTTADATLGLAGQLHGTVTDAKKRGLFDVDVDIYDAATKEFVTFSRTSPYGGFRVLGLRAGTYKIKVSQVADLGYRPVYVGGQSTLSDAKTFTVGAGQDVDLGTRALRNTKPLFTSRATPVLTYTRPLVQGTRVTVKGSGTTKPSGATVTGTYASRRVDPATGVVDDSLLLARIWDTGSLGSFKPFAGRQYVYVRTYSKKGYATTTIASKPTVVSQ